MRLEVEAGAGRGTLDHPGKAGRGEQAVVNGDPRSLTKTNGDVSLSRWSRRTPGSRLPSPVSLSLSVQFGPIRAPLEM